MVDIRPDLSPSIYHPIIQDIMSDLFGGGGGEGCSAKSLTESIFGAATSANNDSTCDLFSTNPQPSASPSYKRPRICIDDKTNVGTSAVEKEDIISREETLNRRRRQSQDEILDQLTISLGDYRKGINDDELYDDVRGLMKHHGLVIIRNAISQEDVAIITTMANATQIKICDTLDAKNIPYNSPINNTKTICYKELAIRCQGRMDVRYLEEGYDTTNNKNEGKNKHENNEKSTTLPTLTLIDNLAASVLHGAEPPNLVYSGWIFSFPNSVNQPWHQDGSPLFEHGTESLPSYAINVFCGLHNINDDDDELILELGPTEFVVGSHHMKPEIAIDKVDSAVSAVLGKGDILLYDYRICHRGTSNLSSSLEEEVHQKGNSSSAKEAGVNRKVLYLMYARPWFREHLNFGSTSLFC